MMIKLESSEDYIARTNPLHFASREINLSRSIVKQNVARKSDAYIYLYTRACQPSLALVLECASKIFLKKCIIHSGYDVVLLRGRMCLRYYYIYTRIMVFFF